MADGQIEESQKVIQNVKRLVRDMTLLGFFALTILLASSVYKESHVELFGKDYALEVVLLVLFAVIFLPLSSLMFYDLKKILDNFSQMIIRNFPGMKEELPPMTAIMRSLVQIILIFLLSVVVVPLTAPFSILGVSLSGVISGVMLALVAVFAYVIIRNIYDVAEGYVGEAIGRFVAQEARLFKRKGRKKNEEAS